MLIPEQLLLSYGAETETLEPSHIIFNEGENPKYYYQIIEGRIKLNHYNDEGKELILAILDKGLSVCELLLFIDKTYPVNAVTFETCTILKLPKSHFTKLLDENPAISRDINKFLSERLYYKYIMLENNSSLRPETRITGMLDYHKSFYEDQTKFSYEVPLTRQQIAALTALRVETVVRTVKKLEKENYLKIINRKIYV
ncbi:cAMP-binding domain of CRP or a regulatory subunit of cAMP-dependent protein kinases [Chryseobacterium arachidis]|uniref:cAMP-binding domain of CRP or a regulatory subunit of cAMP-dependent protein kinases n=1 Tax=Chryseobacterium arachidis TaxID=1416778 RepID=A0A1M4X852_9FLAO|nr:Crp/Fnr family transcriptional regulator [Chryseobacterium arachidis]SHE89669.1 cAMP-binding domain of CRP or a regulatory subunit of cAMP-dependent protein kinases [Chryseobacterium arachidis]